MTDASSDQRIGIGVAAAPRSRGETENSSGADASGNTNPMAVLAWVVARCCLDGRCCGKVRGSGLEC